MSIAPQIEWYLARDGQQFGPLSDVEMRKFVELGHLRPTDLVWRQGFADWRPAPVVFPPRAAPQPAPPRRPMPMQEPARPAPAAAPAAAARRQEFAPQTRPETAYAPFQASRTQERAVAPTDTLSAHDPSDVDDELDDVDKPRRRWGRKLALALILLAIIGGGGWLLAKQPHLINRVLAMVQSGSEPPPETLRSTPFRLTDGSAGAIDQTFQKAALWQILKREFPDWYGARVQEAVKLKGEQNDDSAIARHFASAIVALRREHAQQALAASPTALRTIATSFLANLKHLEQQSVDACYGYISQGETNPRVLDLMNSPEHVQPLQRQITSVFAAVAEGRKSPQTHVPPRKTDYETLRTALTERGWTDKDLRLFSDPSSLAQASPTQVCKLVQDWFAAQLAIKEPEVQLRLLGESLKPVVAG